MFRQIYKSPKIKNRAKKQVVDIYEMQLRRTILETLHYLVRMFRCFGPDDLARRAGLYYFAGHRLPTPELEQCS